MEWSGKEYNRINKNSREWDTVEWKLSECIAGNKK